jgi:hypothetical protein
MSECQVVAYVSGRIQEPLASHWEITVRNLSDNAFSVGEYSKPKARLEKGMACNVCLPAQLHFLEGDDDQV